MTHTSPHRHTVVIIGGGFSGTILAAQLLRQATSPISVMVIERAHSRGLGVAYSTPHGCHLLNVPAAKMSAFPDDAEHFLRWVRANYDPDTEPGTFVPRRVYGQYINAALHESQQASLGQLHWIEGEVVSVTPCDNSAMIRLRTGEVLAAEKVVLALGNFRPSDPKLPGKTAHSSRYISYAWDEAALADAQSLNSVLLIGSGLTSVDLALALRARQFNGVIHVISRRGLLPRRHRSAKPWPPFWNQDSPRTVRGLLRLVRMQVKIAAKQGSDWRAVVDSLRPFTQKIWASLSFEEKRRFLRHLRPYWEVHRHRVAPEIGEFLGAQVADCHMQAHAGRITQYEETESGVTVSYFDRISRKNATIRVDRVINCTGPETDCRRLEDPLLTQLFSHGYARPDALQLGIDASPEGALLNAYGSPSDVLFVIGPSRKGSLWETTAVPELRAQAADLVDELLPLRVEPERVELPIQILPLQA